ncbi:MAG: tetratricopeptide repeat protein, partial [Thermoanaerobaculia bacterium]
SLEMVIELEPDSLRARLMLGRVFELLSQPAAAAAQFTAALELAPDELAAWLGLARARLLLDELPAAREALERALSLAPDHPQVVELDRQMATEGDR